jgi:alpha-glucosidase (family GH31 glycosyl hydrolase)
MSVYAHDTHIRLTAGSEANRPMVMPRYAWLGQHRYCCGFSGDQDSAWPTLQAEVAMVSAPL